MTRNHLLPNCDGALVTARALKKGDCILTVVGNDTVVNATRDLKNSGIYTAVSEHEFIVVDGIVASPFALAHGFAHSFFNKDDINDWCKNNANVLEAATDKEVKEIAARRRLDGREGEDSSSNCVALLKIMFENYKDEGVGWGTDGWGYRHFKAIRGGLQVVGKKKQRKENTRKRVA